MNWSLRRWVVGKAGQRSEGILQSFLLPFLLPSFLFSVISSLQLSSILSSLSFTLSLSPHPLHPPALPPPLPLTISSSPLPFLSPPPPPPPTPPPPPPSPLPPPFHPLQSFGVDEAVISGRVRHTSGSVRHLRRHNDSTSQPFFHRQVSLHKQQSEVEETRPKLNREVCLCVCAVKEENCLVILIVQIMQSRLHVRTSCN